MKSFYFPLILTILVLGCSQKEKSLNHFLLSDDTLLLKTEKNLGHGLFRAGAGFMHSRDTTENYLFPLVFPDNIMHIQVDFCFVDIRAWLCNKYLQGDSKLEYLLDDIANHRVDTLQCPTTEQNYVGIMTGFRDTVRVLIVDENHNMDFRDDSVRVFPPFLWNSDEFVIPCTYNIYDGTRIVEDSSWLKIGLTEDSDILFLWSQYVTVDFTLGKNAYNVGASNEQSGFTFDEPLIALLSENGISKDTLLLKEQLHLGEYLRLGETYYRFAKISNSGTWLTLVKEKDFNNKIGTQVGLLAPEFSCVTYTNDTLLSTRLHTKPLLIANISGCYSRSFGVYTEMTEKYGDQLIILGLTPHIAKDYGAILCDTEDPFNKGIYDSYRNAYSSYTCYLIGKNNRIMDIFDVFDWEKKLVGLD